MIIKSKDTIAGLPALKVRKFLKQVRRYDFFDEKYVAKHLALSISEARTFIKKLVALKFITTIKNKSKSSVTWEITPKGISLSVASARPIKRQAADKQFKELLSRVEVVNSDPSYLYRVSVVVLFGSFLSNKPEIGDIDVAIDLKVKESNLQKNEVLRNKKIKDAVLHGKRFSSWMEEISWPELEVWSFLKSRSRGLKLHNYSIHKEFLMTAPHKIIFQSEA